MACLSFKEGTIRVGLSPPRAAKRAAIQFSGSWACTGRCEHGHGRGLCFRSELTGSVRGRGLGRARPALVSC